MKQRIFISSVQKEFAEERQALKAYIQGDALLSRFFDVFLFEDIPARDRRADAVYLEEVRHCDLYLALLGDQYGTEDTDGLSPTHREFNKATTLGKPRLVFVKAADDSARHPKMRALIATAEKQLIRRRFANSAELIPAVYASLVQQLEYTGTIQSRPFDEQLCLDATLDDIDVEAVRRFVRRAQYERRFSLPPTTPVSTVLAHLNLIRDGRPTHAAVLLFAHDPQRFVPSAEIRCMHFHGTEIQRPAPFYRIFKGNLFAQVDQTTNFALSVINYSVGTRATGSQAPATYEIPADVIQEAIVNAVAHRDYHVPAAIQVSVFADRIEVWNPGEIMPPLTFEQLRQPHSSVSRNARVCEALYLARYIEKYGTGTLMMIRESTAHALPEPDFGQRSGDFIATLWRDWLTEAVMDSFGLGERLRQAITQIKIHRRISNTDYQRLMGTPRRTATRDLETLVQKRILRLEGKGRGAFYVLAGKPGTNAPEMRQMRQSEQTSQESGGLGDRAAIAPSGITAEPSAKRARKGTNGTSAAKPKRARNEPNGPHRRKTRGGRE
jgi:predicted HTH transcriptional regulator